MTVYVSQDVSYTAAVNKTTLKCVQGAVAEAELLRVVKERDELKAALLEFEKHMLEIQNNIKSLSAERDHYKTQSKQVTL